MLREISLGVNRDDGKKEVRCFFALILGILAAIFLITSAIGFCGLYVPFKISTRKKAQ